MIDNVDLDLSGVDLSRPLLDNQTILCRTGEVRFETENDKTNLLVPLTLEGPGKSTTNKEVLPGFVHTDRILSTPVGKLTKEMIREKLARFQVATLKLKSPKLFTPEECSGQLVLVTFGTRPDRQDPSRLYQDVVRYSKAP